MRRRQTSQTRSQRTGGRPNNSYDMKRQRQSLNRSISRPSGTRHMMPDGTYMPGAYHGASPQPNKGGGGLYPYNPGGGDITMGLGMHCSDGGNSFSVDCHLYNQCPNMWDCNDVNAGGYTWSCPRCPGVASYQGY